MLIFCIFLQTLTECLQSRSLSEQDNGGTYVNCICLQSQLSRVLEELKSLKTIIFLLQKEHGISNTDLVQCEQSKTESLDFVDVHESHMQCTAHDKGHNQGYKCTQK
jgi:hypothetical protein